MSSDTRLYLDMRAMAHAACQDIDTALDQLDRAAWSLFCAGTDCPVFLPISKDFLPRLQDVHRQLAQLLAELRRQLDRHSTAAPVGPCPGLPPAGVGTTRSLLPAG